MNMLHRQDWYFDINAEAYWNQVQDQEILLFRRFQADGSQEAQHRWDASALAGMDEDYRKGKKHKYIIAESETFPCLSTSMAPSDKGRNCI